MQLWPEGFERSHRRNRYKRIVLFNETFIASVQIEEAKLSHANLPRSEHESLESDSRGGGERLFFEVPLRSSSEKLRQWMCSRSVRSCSRANHRTRLNSV